MASKSNHPGKSRKRAKGASIADQTSAEVAPRHAPPPKHPETAFVRFIRLAEVVDDIADTIDRDG
jgi:hypothetical protein